MDWAAITLTVIGVVAAAGGIAAYFARSRGAETIRLLQVNIQSYKDSETLKNARIQYLEGQLTVKDETIKRLLSYDKK